MVTATEYRRAVETLAESAIRDLAGLLLAISSDDPAVVRRALIDYLPDMVTPYMENAAETAATLYEDERRVTGVNGYARTQVAEADARRWDALARWGVRPLSGQSDSTVLSLVGGGVQRLIAASGRDTVDVNARTDAGRGEIAATAWSRVARPGACQFCTMLAGRGAVYRSAESAGAVIGRGVDPSKALDEAGNRRAGYVGGVGGGVRSRGSQELAADFHDNCHCITRPTFYRREVMDITTRGYTRPESVLVPFAA